MYAEAKSKIPLAERVRPQVIADFIGQDHLVKPGGALPAMLATGNISSMLFWGPPGVGKTTLAQIIANTIKQPFFTLSAIDAGVKEVRAVIDLAKKAGKAVLFIDEIHRFNKAQQDSLLHAVEKGIICLIGATTENPSFEVIGALLSRCQVFVLKALTIEELQKLVHQALSKDAWLQQQHIEIQEWSALVQLSGGDARKLLNIFELVVSTLPSNEKVITDAIVQDIIQQKMMLYDKTGEQHYDIISAYIKSIRGSDPNAALYYLARMIKGGEDPKFIARRLVILASEDIGNANPNALLLATNCFQAVSLIGYPECRIVLAQTTTYLASSAKSNAAYMGIEDALALVEKTGDLPIPMHLRNAPTQLMKSLEYGKGYEYAHQYEHNFVYQEFMPDAISGTKLYQPGHNAAEDKMRAYLKQCWLDKYGY